MGANRAYLLFGLLAGLCVALLALATYLTPGPRPLFPRPAPVVEAPPPTPTATSSAQPSITPSPTETPRPTDTAGPRLSEWVDNRLVISGRVLNEYGDPVALAAVRWRRVSREADGIPPFWTHHGEEATALSGWNAGHTTLNPLSDGLSEPIRLGRGFWPFDTGVAHRIATVPGHRYRATVDSRYVLSYMEEQADRDNSEEMWFSDFRVEFGVDVTGQETHHRAPTIRAVSCRMAPATVWAPYQIAWTAENEWTTLWFRASSSYTLVSLAWFDNLRVVDETTGKRHEALAALNISDVVDGRARTDREGRFFVALDQPGHYLFDAQARGYQRAWTERDFAASTDPFEIVLPAGTVLAGRVTDAASGKPLEDCAVTVLHSERTLANGTPIVLDKTLTDEQGRFAFGSLQPHQTFQLTAGRPGYLEAGVEAVAAGREDVELALEPGFSIVATVWWDESRRPAPRARIYVFDAEGNNVANALTAPENTAVLTVPAAGEYRLLATDEHARLATPERCTAAVTVSDPHQPAEVELFLSPGGTLELAVVYAHDHSPAGNVYLGAYLDAPDPELGAAQLDEGFGKSFFQSVSDSAGTIVFNGLVPGMYWVQVVKGPHAIAFEALAANNPLAGGEYQQHPAARVAVALDTPTRVTVPVKANYLIEGTVVGPDRAPVAAQVVFLPPESWGPSGWTHVPPVWTGPDGVFRLAPESPGPWTIGARAGGVGVAKMIVRELGEPVLIVLGPWSTVHGTVRWANGDPVAERTIRVRELGRGESGGCDTRTRADGSFELEPLAPELYQLTVEASEHFLGTYTPLDLRQQPAETVLDIVLPRPLTITLTCLAQANGEPLAGVPVGIQTRASPAEGTGLLPRLPTEPAQTDGNGIAVFENMPPGRYRVVTEDGRPWPCDPEVLDFAAGQSANVTVRLGRPSVGRIRSGGDGVIIDLGGAILNDGNLGDWVDQR